MLVAEQVTKAQLAGFHFRFQAAGKRPVLGAGVVNRVACHPEGFFVGHSYLGRSCVHARMRAWAAWHFAILLPGPASRSVLNSAICNRKVVRGCKLLRSIGKTAKGFRILPDGM